MRSRDWHSRPSRQAGKPADAGGGCLPCRRLAPKSPEPLSADASIVPRRFQRRTGRRRLRSPRRSMDAGGALSCFRASRRGGGDGGTTGRIWRIQGSLAADGGSVYSDRGVNAWAALPAMPTPRGSPAAALLDGRIHVVGGVTPDRRNTDAHGVFDLRRKPGRAVRAFRPPETISF